MNNSGSTIVYVFTVMLGIFMTIGEVMCIVKCISSDWEPSYKREIIYGASALSGIGAIVGYLNIPDIKK